MFFKSTKSTYFIVIVLIAVFGLLFGSFCQLFARNDLMVIIPFQLICWACIILLVWIYFKTYYQLTSEYLLYRTGPITGKIKIDRISEIITGKIAFANFKPATGINGLILKYNRWDEIYISPENKDKFIEELLKLNKNILITDLSKKV